MKFQVRRSLWCNSTGFKWTVIELGDLTFCKMGTVEKKGEDTIAYVKVDENIYNSTVESMTSSALYNAMWMIREHEKGKIWRRDFGQI